MKKIIFIDLDGTIIDHTDYSIPTSTKDAIYKAQSKGHHIVLATGRPPTLLYDIDRQLNIDTIIAANGRYVSHKGEVIFEQTIDASLVETFVEDMYTRGLDVGFVSSVAYAMPYKQTDIGDKFSDYFSLERPTLIKDFHKKNPVLQMILFYESETFDHIAKDYPQLDFNLSCPYGIDINIKGGMKELGMKKVLEHLDVSVDQTVAIGDGLNDRSMLESANIGIAMGNAREEVKHSADYVTDTVSNDGVYQAFQHYRLI